MDQHLAQGTSLFILLPPIGLGALREYWKQGQVDLNAGILCALGMLFGGYAGSLIAVPMPSRNLKGLFGCFLMLAGFFLWGKAQLGALAGGGGEAKARCRARGVCPARRHLLDRLSVPNGVPKVRHSLVAPSLPVSRA